jgi:hypothetical protein
MKSASAKPPPEGFRPLSRVLISHAYIPLIEVEKQSGVYRSNE